MSDLEFLRLRSFFLSHAHDKTKKIFPYFLTKLKTCHLSYFINKLEHRAQLFQGWLTLTQPALG